MKTKFLLLYGPSGVGKTTCIEKLKSFDQRFVYISPYTTRKLRDHEIDKIHITSQELNALARNGELIAINYLYNACYATPRASVEDAFRAAKFPILDWPIQQASIMQAAFPNHIFGVYIEPPSVEVLQHRLMKDHRDREQTRLKSAITELQSLNRGEFDSVIDLRIVSRNERVDALASQIYVKYLESLSNMS